MMIPINKIEIDFKKAPVFRRWRGDEVVASGQDLICGIRKQCVGGVPSADRLVNDYRKRKEKNLLKNTTPNYFQPFGGTTTELAPCLLH